MGALLGSLTAMGIGIADVFGRRVTARGGPITAAAAMQAGGALTALVSVLFVSSELIWFDFGLGALSGLGMGVGLACYFGGLTRSSSAVVAPMVATLSALVPYLYTLVRGSHPSTFAVAGAALALVGLGLITVGGVSPDRVRVGLVWGLASGLGYGFGLTVVIETSSASGSWPGFGQRVVAWALMMAVATVAKTSRYPPAGVRMAAVAAGLFVGLTSIFYIAGVQIDAQTTVVTASTFPAFSVLGGWLFYQDEVAPMQVGGIVAVLVGVAGVVLG